MRAAPKRGFWLWILLAICSAALLGGVVGVPGMVVSGGGPPYDPADLELLQRITFRKDTVRSSGKVQVSWDVKGSRGAKTATKTVAPCDVQATKREVVELALATSRKARQGASSAPQQDTRASREAVDVLHFVSYTEAAEQQHHAGRRAAAAAAATAAAAVQHEQQQQHTVTISGVDVPVDALRTALQDPALCAQVGVEPQQHADTARAIGENVRALLPTLTQQSRSEVGRKCTAATMAAAVPSSSSNNDMPNLRYAEFLGVSHHLVATARERRSAAMEAAAAGASAAAALSSDMYFYERRKPTRAALPQEMEQCIDAFWHTSNDSGGPARASGNTKEVKRESKARGATAHPVRHMHMTGEAAYTRFLEWPQYTELRAVLRRPNGALWWPERQHVSRSAFLDRRCWCIETVRHEVATRTCAAQQHNADK